MSARPPKIGFAALSVLASAATASTLSFGAPFSTLRVLAQTQVAPSRQESESIRFEPPDVVAPNHRQSGATRSGMRSRTRPLALIPTKASALTLAAHPTFFFYVPESLECQAGTTEFVIFDENDKEVYATTIPRSQPGVISHSLPATVTLQPLKNYQWHFSLVCDPNDRSSDMFLIGKIRRVNPDPALTRKLEAASPRKRPGLYAAAGIWHEALSTLAELRRSNPNDAALKSDWENLLKSVGLEKIAKEPLVTDASIQNLKARQIKAAQLFKQGSEQYRTSQFLAAQTSWQQALNLFREISDPEFEGKTLSNLGLVYYSLGDYTKAIESYQQSLAIAQKLQDRQTQGRVLGNLGLTHDAVGDLERAIDYYQKSLAIAREITDFYGEGQTLGNLGSAYFALRDYNKVIETQQQRLRIVKKIKHRQGEGAALNKLGLSSYALGKLTDAVKFYQQSLTIARDIQDRRGEAQVLGNLGLAYLGLGNASQAIEVLQQNLKVVQTIQDRPGEGTALNNLGFALLEAGKLTEATDTLRAGIQVWESLRAGLGDNDAYKVSIFEEQARTYTLLQQALITQNKTNEALEVAERGRARAFVELLAQRQKTVSSASPNIQQIQQIALTHSATLVNYSIGRNALYVWVVKPTGEVAFRSIDFKTTDLVNVAEDSRAAAATLASGRSLADDLITSFVRGARSAVGVTIDNASQPNAASAARSPSCRGSRCLKQMYSLLIQSIADELPTNPEALVVFIPHRDLFLVPFAALQDQNGKFLLEKHTILIAPSIQVLDLTRQQRLRIRQVAPQNSIVVGIRRDAVVVGNPIMPKVPPKIGEPPKPLAPLPGAEAEAQAIAELLKTQALTGKQGTKAAVMQQVAGARIIHLATHGLLGDLGGTGIPGAIALAPSGNDNGLLTANEILNLKLNAELVVLSACDTGRGRITGDGVIGLSRAFITAGTPSIVVSLWRVSDESTAFLMPEFYRQLASNPNKAQALRQAMLKTMKKHPNPSDWAAFTLIGEAE